MHLYLRFRSRSTELTPLPPGAGVSRRIDLDDDPDAAYPRVIGQVLHVVGRINVIATIRAPSRHLRELRRVERETLGIGQVPVQRVELRGRHAVDDPLQLLDREKLPAGVDEKAAIRERGLVLDGGSREDAKGALLASSLVPPNQLAEGLETVPHPEVAPPRDPGFQDLPLRHELQLVRLVGIQRQGGAPRVAGA